MLNYFQYKRGERNMFVPLPGGENVGLLNQLKRIIESRGGDKIDIDIKDCDYHLSTHNGSCIRCSSRLGCVKLAQLLRLQLLIPFSDKVAIEHMEDVLKARTVQEAIGVLPL